MCERLLITLNVGGVHLITSAPFTPPTLFTSISTQKSFVFTLDTAWLFLFTSTPLDKNAQDAPSVLGPMSLMYTKERE